MGSAGTTPPWPCSKTDEGYSVRLRNAGNIADEFGRTNFGFGPLQAPFCVAKVTPVLFHTQGGVRVDAHARVLRPDGTPIAGLFAGGGVAAGVSGLAGAEGYA